MRIHLYSIHSKLGTLLLRRKNTKKIANATKKLDSFDNLQSMGNQSFRHPKGATIHLS